MTSNLSSLRALLTPIFVLFSSLALIVIGAMFIRDPAAAARGSSFVSITPIGLNEPAGHDSSQAAKDNMAIAESQAVANLEFFNSRFERYTKELTLEEEKALGRSDLVTTRYRMDALRDNLTTLQELTVDWAAETEQITTEDVGLKIAADRELLQVFDELDGETRMSARDVKQTQEQLKPLADFVAMLEQQDKVPYEPSERFHQRLTSLSLKVTVAVFEMRESLAQLRHLHRSAANLPVGEEPLMDAVYRLRRERRLNVKTESGSESDSSSSSDNDTVVTSPTTVISVIPVLQEPNSPEPADPQSHSPKTLFDVSEFKQGTAFRTNYVAPPGPPDETSAVQHSTPFPRNVPRVWTTFSVTQSNQSVRCGKCSPSCRCGCQHNCRCGSRRCR